MIASATGESIKDNRLSCEAARTKTAQEPATNVATNAGLSAPLGSARVWVRGLEASIEASARRLNAMAAERAATIATMIQANVCPLGQPWAASIAPERANGSTKTECSHLIISRVTRRLWRIGTRRL